MSDHKKSLLNQAGVWIVEPANHASLAVDRYITAAGVMRSNSMYRRAAVIDADIWFSSTRFDVFDVISSHDWLPVIATHGCYSRISSKASWRATASALRLHKTWEWRRSETLAAGKAFQLGELRLKVVDARTAGTISCGLGQEAWPLAPNGKNLAIRCTGSFRIEFSAETQGRLRIVPTSLGSLPYPERIVASIGEMSKTCTINSPVDLTVQEKNRFAVEAEALDPSESILLLQFSGA